MESRNGKTSLGRIVGIPAQTISFKKAASPLKTFIVEKSTKMTELVTIQGSRAVTGPKLNFFTSPPTDVGQLSYRHIPISPFTTGINPVDFQIDAQSEYLDLSRSYVEMEVALKLHDGTNILAASNLWPANNLAHTFFRQVNIKFNGTLISPQTDTYHYKAYLEALLNNDRADGKTILAPQLWFNALDPPTALTAHNIDSATPHQHWTDLSATNKTFINESRAAKVRFVGGNRVKLRFKPSNEVFHLSKLLLPGVQIQMQFYFNPPTIFLNGVALQGRMTADDVKMTLYLCQVTLNPGSYASTERDLTAKKLAKYPTVRGEIRTYTVAADNRQKEIQNPFGNRIPNRVIVALVDTAAFSGAYERSCFAFGKYNLSSVRQLVRGEEYPYDQMEMPHNNGNNDLIGYHRFLDATGCLVRQGGNMVQADEWGHGKNCNLYVFENAANGQLDSAVLNPKLVGELKLVLNFGANPRRNLTVIVYGEFENLLEVDGNKAVMYNVYEQT